MFALDFSDFGQEEEETISIYSCVYRYAKIRERFASPDGLYTHFKYAKKGERYVIFV